MSEDVEMLQEVVVIGYGSQKLQKFWSNFNYKIGRYCSSKPVRVEEALQGRASGSTLYKTVRRVVNQLFLFVEYLRLPEQTPWSL